MVDAARISAVVPPSIVTSAFAPESSLVVIVTAPVNALVVVSRAIVALFALVVSVVVPVIASAPLSVMLPAVAVAARFPPTVAAAKVNPLSFTTVALPDPWVVKATVPSTASVPRLITPELSSVVAARLPPTVTSPLSIIPDALPLLTVRSPSIVDAARISAVVPPSIVTFASVPVSSLVVIVTAPVNALVVVSNAIVALFALVVRVVVPVIASAPLSVMLPAVAVAARFPPTVAAAKVNPVAFTTVALPDPSVVS